MARGRRDLAERELRRWLDLVDPARGALVSLAARLGRTRLIDNLVLAPVAPAPRPAGLDVSSHR